MDQKTNSKMISAYASTPWITYIYNYLRLFGSTGEDWIGSWGSNFSRIRLTFKNESTDSVSPFEIDSPRDDSESWGETRVNWGEMRVKCGVMRVNWGGIRVNWGEIRVNWGEMRVNWGGIRVNWGEIRLNWGEMRVNWGGMRVNLGEVRVKRG